MADDRLRVDKWLWHARFFKSRSLAAEAASAGTLRVNGNRVSKPAHTVQPGDVLTFPAGGRTRVVRIEALGSRRGPAPEAQQLYSDLDPPADPELLSADVTRPRGEGRPTKRDRREIDAWRRGET